MTHTSQKKMTPAQVVFLVAAIYETILAIPIIGGTIIFGTGWTALHIAFVLHVVAGIIAFTEKPRGPFTGSVVGIIASIIGYIPILGWVLHVIAALVNYGQAFGYANGDDVLNARAGSKTTSSGNSASKASKKDDGIKDAEIVE